MTAQLVASRVKRVKRFEFIPRREDRAAVGVIAVAIALLPALHPKGPGHLAPADLAIAIAIVFSLLWAAWTRSRVVLPYAIPMALMVLAGAAAAIGGIAPKAGAQAIIQDLFLLLWCAAIATVCRTPWALRVVTVVWAWSATAWAAILVGGRLSGNMAIAGVHRGYTGGRAQGTFDHPNMAGNYFAISLFVLLATKSPRHPIARAGACLMIGGALFYTGSNAALLGVIIAGGVCLFLAIRRRADIPAAIAVTLIVSAFVGVTGYLVHQATAHKVENSNLVRNSVARSSKSGAARQVLFKEELRLARTGPLRGWGPASTKLALGGSSSGPVKEAHDDFLATLTERGPLGVIGLALLIGAIVTRATGVLSGRLSPAYSAAIPSVVALVGTFVIFASSSVVHEILHYRHLWALLGILAALYHFGRLPSSTATEVAP